jgi:primosomal protein N' (replication factor Y)
MNLLDSGILESIDMDEAKNFYFVAPLAYSGATSVYAYHSEAVFAVGDIAQITIGRRKSLGVITGISPRPTFTTKPLGDRIDVPTLPNYLVELADWMMDYYAASAGSVWSSFLPSGITKSRRVTKVKPAKTAPIFPDSVLTPQQSVALESIRKSSKRAHLIHGVTGSGKTRLYLELAKEALVQNKSVLILVPEITLTPQLVGQFEMAFSDLVISSHSKLTEAQRHKIWDQASAATSSRSARVIVGPRSCLFLPTHDLGLVVVDECHETSYKQEQHPRYQAVTVAGKLGGLTGARVILGSATPGLNELYLAQAGRIGYERLTERANKIIPPSAEIIDLRNKDLLKLSKFITQPLIENITKTLQEGRQVLLYLNRRGSATSQVCGDCGHVTICPTCRLPLTFHADLMRLLCHHCNYRQISAAICPECKGGNIKLLGGGTKRIEVEVERLWPDARIARLDRDSATLNHIEAVYAGLKNGTIDIVIGTQMIAKGLDLPAIDTVGIISADTMLHLPDYTAAERTFDLLSQVSGRAGRGDRAGRIFIQTYSPEHPAIQAAAHNDYDTFADNELVQRKAHTYPPYTYLAKVSVSSTDRIKAQNDATKLAKELTLIRGIRLNGPAPAFIEVQGAKYHWVMSIASPERRLLQQIAMKYSGQAIFDLDPVNLL